jgi:hypothetical protein
LFATRKAWRLDDDRAAQVQHCFAAACRSSSPLAYRVIGRTSPGKAKPACEAG